MCHFLGELCPIFRSKRLKAVCTTVVQLGILRLTIKSKSLVFKTSKCFLVSLFSAPTSDGADKNISLGSRPISSAATASGGAQNRGSSQQTLVFEVVFPTRLMNRRHSSTEDYDECN